MLYAKKKASRGTQIRINSDILDIFFILKSQHLNNQTINHISIGTGIGIV
jgi:hypothetical protein